MIDPATLVTYVLIVTGFVFVPGPAILLTVARATGSGTRVGLATALGIAIGGAFHTAFAIVGLSALVLASGVLFTLVKVLGAGYLIYIGLRLLLTDPSPTNGPAPRPISASAAFRQAILAEVLNPKTALFFVAFLPQFVDATRGAVPAQLALLGIIVVVIGFAATATYALAAGHLGARIRTNRRFQRWQARVTGTLYCALGLRLAIQDR